MREGGTRSVTDEVFLNLNELLIPRWRGPPSPAGEGFFDAMKAKKAPREAGRELERVFADTGFNQTVFNIIDNQFRIVGNVLLEVIGVPFGLFNAINRFVPTH